MEKSCDMGRLFVENQLEELLGALNSVKIHELNDLETILPDVFSVFKQSYLKNDQENNKITVKCLNILKRSCVNGKDFQNKIIKTGGLLNEIQNVFKSHTIENTVKLNSLQLLANLCVQNEDNQEVILQNYKDFFLENLKTSNIFTNVATMILYNAFLSKCHTELTEISLLLALLENISKCHGQDLPDFICIFMENMITENQTITELYKKLETDERITFLDYITEYIKQESNQRTINIDLFKHLILEFKKKSDNILKTEKHFVDQIHPDEILTMLKFITEACSIEPYSIFLKKDAGLFLNVGILLRNVVKAGKKSDSVFTPIQKIADVAASKKSDLIEKEISYSLKNSLVKILTNLSHQNRKNQDLAREMEIMATILECTNLDARNPMIKEWSILAIRNLCENNLENQKFIASLTKLGNADNSLVTEYSNDGGTIRIRDEA